MGSIHAQGASDMFFPAVHDADFSRYGDFRDWTSDACHCAAGKTGTYGAEY